jgi:prepilin signal peptidase PulO-like enzyme (type II secretory pathway)
MNSLLLFVFGAAIGSFLNVVSLRYKEGGRIFFTKTIQGRSHCNACLRTLSWYELIPLLSYLLLLGKCKTCRVKLSPQYFLIEAACGLLVATIPHFLFMHLGGSSLLRTQEGIILLCLVVFIWLLITFTALTLTAIDIRLKIIPDETNVFLAILGIGIFCIRYIFDKSFVYGSFTGPSAQILGHSQNLFTSSGIAILFALFLFGGIVLLTRGRGMGMGDVKLAIPMALILGWPDTLIAFVAAFIIGSVVGIFQMARKKATMKAMLPFGPFLIAGMYVVVFFGRDILEWYFGLL